jgi:hypothetical protein
MHLAISEAVPMKIGIRDSATENNCLLPLLWEGSGEVENVR